MQLWNVGAGLPLDALKKGAITSWTCPYELTSAEISPLLDALCKNASLTYIDLSASGMEWDGPDASGRPLVETMCKQPSALAALTTLRLQKESGYLIPTKRLRTSASEALAALRSQPLLSVGGARREEIMFMAGLLRKNQNFAVVERAEAAAGEVVAKMLEAACKGKLKRDAWELQLTSLLVEGATRRGHLTCLVAVETLRDVGFGAAELLAVGHTLAQLKAGGYLAREMKELGLKVTVLKETGYARVMRVWGTRAYTAHAPLSSWALTSSSQIAHTPSHPYPCSHPPHTHP